MRSDKPPADHPSHPLEKRLGRTEGTEEKPLAEPQPEVVGGKAITPAFDESKEDSDSFKAPRRQFNIAAELSISTMISSSDVHHSQNTVEEVAVVVDELLAASSSQKVSNEAFNIPSAMPAHFLFSEAHQLEAAVAGSNAKTKNETPSAEAEAAADASVSPTPPPPAADHTETEKNKHRALEVAPTHMPTAHHRADPAEAVAALEALQHSTPHALGYVKVPGLTDPLIVAALMYDEMTRANERFAIRTDEAQCYRHNSGHRRLRAEGGSGVDGDGDVDSGGGGGDGPPASGRRSL